MKEINRIGRAAIVAAAVLALAFGARQAMARTPTLCDPPIYAGTCAQNPDCDKACKDQNGPDWFGQCAGVCCACYL